MMPVLFKIPGLGWDIPGYGLMLMISFLLSIMWAARRAANSQANPDVILNCGFLALIGGVVGARAMYVIHYWEQFADAGSTAQVIIAVINVRKGGLAVYGGVVFSVVLVAFYLWRSKLSWRWYLDIMAPSAALGMSIGRIGCFLNGCCWGGVCDLPWAVRFPFGSPPAVQQWTDQVPGAELPPELLFEAPVGVLPAGQTAIPIPRDSFYFSDEELDQARAVYAEVQAAKEELDAKLVETTDPQRKKRLQAEFQALRKTKLAPLLSTGGCSPQLQLNLGAEQMHKHDLSAAELRELARRYPSLPVHPAQLYSVIALGLVALLLNALYWRRTRDGQVICALFIIEPPTRWALEVLRPDNPLDVYGITISQFLALVLVPLGVLGLLLLRFKPPRSPRAVPWEPPAEEQTSKKARGAGAR
ncbi:MAG: prolipoprotein diacylglyceryl transferase [Phycisphaerae bacterium]|nr:prolipoprotein diacylglyceryl transferase [Phycisphaerae bacterium]